MLKILLLLLCSGLLWHCEPFFVRDFASYFPSARSQCGISDQTTGRILKRVIGGSESEVGQWPWLVTLQSPGRNGNFHKCGGTIIADRWILTAAHCFMSNTKPRHWVAVLGNHDLTKDEHHERAYVVEQIHFYDQNKRTKHDIALVELAKKIRFTANIQPLCLPRPKTHSNNYQVKKLTCTAAGWGSTRGDTPNGSSDVLKHVQLKLLPNAQCMRLVKKKIGDSFSPKHIESISNVLCTFNGGGQSNVCMGDSGGPLMCQGTDGRMELAGIVIGGDEICDANNPSFFTDVQSCLSWIYSVLSKGFHFDFQSMPMAPFFD